MGLKGNLISVSISLSQSDLDYTAAEGRRQRTNRSAFIASLIAEHQLLSLRRSLDCPAGCNWIKEDLCRRCKKIRNIRKIKL